MATQLILAALLIGAAVYAQHRIAFHTARRFGVLTTRLALAAVGAALGFVLAQYAPTRDGAILAFLQGFGAVHLPAAIILALKRARGEARS